MWTLPLAYGNLNGVQKRLEEYKKRDEQRKTAVLLSSKTHRKLYNDCQRLYWKDHGGAIGPLCLTQLPMLVILVFATRPILEDFWEYYFKQTKKSLDLLCDLYDQTSLFPKALQRSRARAGISFFAQRFHLHFRQRYAIKAVSAELVPPQIHQQLDQDADQIFA